ncbi:MAG: SIS domain-containing protein [Methyloceanibacter sp.]
MSADPIKAMFDLAAALPDHLDLGAEAAKKLGGLPARRDIDSIVVLGMGTGRTAGQVVRAVGAPTITVPILVESSYEIPACIGAGSLVFAVSGSGNTDEVNHGAAECVARGAKLVAISTAGWLIDFAEERALPIVRIPPEIKPARATFGVVVGALLAALEQVGALPEAGASLASAVAQLRGREPELRRPGNLAERLASDLAGRHVLCQGDTPLGATAAERWKAQINQNARQAASVSEQPNASHNEAVAWDCRNDLTMAREAAVLLRHAYENPRVGKRMDLLARYLDGKVPVHSVHGEGATPLAALMDLIMIGDFTSLHLAVRNGVDPFAVRFISETVKEGMTPPGPKPPGSHA